MICPIDDAPLAEWERWAGQNGEGERYVHVDGHEHTGPLRRRECPDGCACSCHT